MSINLSIKNASDEVVAALKSRAKQNHRSLQGELLAIIEDAAASWLAGSHGRGLREVAAGWRAKDETATAQQPREQAIERAVALMREGVSLGGRRFTRDEMHER
jgi:antitoxin FitA